MPGPYASAHYLLAVAHARQGHVEEACDLLREALSVYVEAGLPRGVAKVRKILEAAFKGALAGSPAVAQLDQQLQAIQ
jgi:hypothetical protein